MAWWITMQGKGGVGKSLITAVYAQYLRDKYGEVQCFDTDPVNDTFRQYRTFGATRINILGEDQNINARAFDGLMEQLLGHEGVAVVDNGASTFVPLMAYMLDRSRITKLAARRSTP
jgi:CO dehydrogenase nickel-insertion accessory protein CooC1